MYFFVLLSYLYAAATSMTTASPLVDAEPVGAEPAKPAAQSSTETKPREDNDHWTTRKPARGQRCVQVQTKVRYGNQGYDHWVRLENTCESNVTCRVRSNANPKPVSVAMKPGTHKNLRIFLGSPARSFKANVHCKQSATGS